MDGGPAAIREAAGTDDVALARALFVEYARWLNVDLCFQGFDRELATLPGAYARPRGRLLLAGEPERAFGCIALRPLGDETSAAGPPQGAPPPWGERRVATLGGDNMTGEVKRLFVQAHARGAGWGRRLVDALLAEARASGYRELRLDTLERMADAQRLYADVGFRRCAPYYANPLPDVVYMALTL